MLTRREFVLTTGALLSAPLVHARGSDEIRVGVVGCGGRGTGAAHDALAASPRCRIVALADVFPERMSECRGRLGASGDRAGVAEGRCYGGFDGYRELVESDLDLVILATPPGFRPAHFAAAVAAGRHVFMEKPVAVDPVGVRTVLAAADAADRAGLSVVAGTQRRHEACYLAAMQRVHQEHALGRIVSARCAWNMGGLWMNPRRPEWSDMEWQLRNWLYFAWLSGDHIVEQHVHNLDVVNWALEAHPLRAIGMGGRQVRTGPEYGSVFDHFAIEYEYPGGVWVTSLCRQIDGCASRVEESIHGTQGTLVTRSGYAALDGVDGSSWVFEGRNPNPYVQEHVDLVASISGGSAGRLNEARTVAESTLSAIMGRMSAYSGREISWEEALASPLDLSPPRCEFGQLPVSPVPVPGRGVPGA